MSHCLTLVVKLLGIGENVVRFWLRKRTDNRGEVYSDLGKSNSCSVLNFNLSIAWDENLLS